MILFEELYDIIIHQMIIHKGVSVQELHGLVSEKHKISLANFYKVIGRFIDEQIIIKENRKLYLHNRRVIGFLDIADALNENYVKNTRSVAQLQEGQALYHEAHSIEAIDGVRGDRMVQVKRMYEDQEAIYVYQAHPYYALGMQKTEIAFFKEIHKLAKVYFLTGNTKLLDHYGISMYTTIGIHTLASEDVPFIKDGYCVTVIGEYVFEVLYPKAISNAFKFFFDSINEIEQFNADFFHTIFEMKANCKLTLRRNTMQAYTIKKVFEKLFSITATKEL